MQAFVPYVPGPVAAAARDCLQRDYVQVVGPVWAPNPSGGQAGWIVFSALAVAAFTTVGLKCSLSGSSRAARHAVDARLGWRNLSDVLQRRTRVVAATATILVFVLMAPAAAAGSWFFSMDLTWPRLVRSEQSYPSIFVAGSTAILCAGASLAAGSVVSRLWAINLRRSLPRTGQHRCATCGYEVRVARTDVCPECGQSPHRRAFWSSNRNIRLTLPWRIVAYAALLACAALGVNVAMLGPPDVEAWCWKIIGRKPQVLMPVYYFASNGPAPLLWRSTTEPVILSWPAGTVVIQERIEPLPQSIESTGETPARITEAWAWCPSTLDRSNPDNWIIDARSFVSQGGTRSACWKVEFADGCSLYRLYTVYFGGICESYVSGWPTELRPVVPADGLEVLRSRLADSLADAAGSMTRSASIGAGRRP